MRKILQMRLDIQRLKCWAATFKRDILALWIAARDRRTPHLATLVAAGIAAYALSPIDLIPDFIPILGYLDDLLIVPAGIALAIRLIPAALMVEYRAEAQRRSDRPRSVVAAFAIILVWIAAIAVAILLLAPPLV
jgi:uncharacterized membrane protein YkvA (DUF1232 family)